MNKSRFETELVNQDSLTKREATILCLLCNALTDKDIAEELHISTRTVQCHIEHIYQKLHVQGEQMHGRVLVIREALSRGLVKLVCTGLCVMAVNNHDMMRVRSGNSARPSITRTRSEWVG